MYQSIYFVSSWYRVNPPVIGHEPITGHSIVFYCLQKMITIEYNGVAGYWFMADYWCIYPTLRMLLIREFLLDSSGALQFHMRLQFRYKFLCIFSLPFRL